MHVEKWKKYFKIRETKVSFIKLTLGGKYMQNLEMEVYNIGQKFPGEVLKSTSISFEDGIIQLIVRLDGLSEMEVESFRNKTADFQNIY